MSEDKEVVSIRFYVSKKNKLPNPKVGSKQNPRKEMQTTGGDPKENTIQTNHKTTCEPPHRAVDESGLATAQEADQPTKEKQQEWGTTHC